MIENVQDLAQLDRQLQNLQTIQYPSQDVAHAANSPRSLLLISIPKCGTTWLRYLLTNCARLATSPEAEPVQYDELKRYWQEREFLVRGKAAPKTTRGAFPNSGIDSLLFQHPHRRRLSLDIWSHLGKKVVVYRNPLDFLVSCYFFYFQYRDDRRETVGSISDIIPAYARYYALCYRFLQRILESGGAEAVSYEALKRDGHGTLSKLLATLGIEMADSAVVRAVEYSDQRVARQQEDARGATLVARLDRGSFVRDGSIGQWKQVMGEQDVALARSILEKHGVGIDSFDLGD